MPPGLVIAAPASGSGKTTVTLGLIAALRARGCVVQPFKCGPDYIDPAFHAAAAGRASCNLDSWAMPAGTIAALAAQAGDADLAIAEGAISAADVRGDFYDIASGAFGRTHDDEITLCKNGGGAHLDLMTAHYILSVARG